MEKLNIEELNKYFDKEVTISGFVDNIRNLQTIRINCKNNRKSSRKSKSKIKWYGNYSN